MASVMSVTYNEGYAVVSSSGTYGAVRPTIKTDISALSEISIVGKAISACNPTLYLTGTDNSGANASLYTDNSVKTTMAVAAGESFELKLDVSKVSGSWFVCFGIVNKSTSYNFYALRLK
jgi:hypothetical protein